MKRAPFGCTALRAGLNACAFDEYANAACVGIRYGAYQDVTPGLFLWRLLKTARGRGKVDDGMTKPIIEPMRRRVFHPSPLQTSVLTLDPGEARHVRDVLRLSAGDAIELFDDSGRIASATIVEATHSSVTVRVESIQENTAPRGPMIVIASAVPKGDRAEWMIEKLSELGVDRLVPLETTRSVVHPEGKNKRDRWIRIATESAKQSRRAGVMTIDPLTPLADAIAATAASGSEAWVLSPVAAASAIDALPRFESSTSTSIVLFIGPEGGWTDEELLDFKNAGVEEIRLTQTILRIETAAVLTAGLFAISRC